SRSRSVTDMNLLVSPFFNQSGVKPGFSEAKDIRIKKDGNLDFKYNGKFVKTSGDDSFCNSLHLQTKLGALIKYDGSLINFNLTPEPMISLSGQDDWNFILSFNTNDSSLENKTCSFDLVFSAWQINSDGTWGFTDEERLSNSISSIHWVAPVISNLQVFIGSPGDENEKTAIITWETDELATSNLDWKTSPLDAWNPLAEDLSADLTSHTREIPNLNSNTQYYFRVRSADTYGNEKQEEGQFETSSQRLGLGPWSDVVINEFLPNPRGADDAPMPDGEWIELYNRGDHAIDLSNWFLTNSQSSHKLLISTANITHSNPGSVGLNISPGEFLVVYRNGSSNFSLNDSFLGDIVTLYSRSRRCLGGFCWWEESLVDFNIYSGILGDGIIENKSFARFPDGSGNWFDPIPSPGGANILEENVPTPTPIVVPEPTLEMYLNSSKTAVSFKVNNLKDFDKLTYEITYDSVNGEKGIVGNTDLGDEDLFIRENLTLGTCSNIEGKVCVYDQGITKIHLKVVLNTGLKTFESEIGY
ncbi:MAG: lamin tail domain-containing protein, partial [Patescibacteria group bacterium]|nr:lamin tail domain-containing protein [Patescibacteria group bacterium]